nr:S8 family serine peptidase [Kibdelosporangium sp. MJ126-NF4]CEL18031.1 Probable secreted peptidase [Kibdelosporangium sp. MJ126-NF4]CTQ90741.1 Probable secreted peptidase [Kibdelosporangium sp. MJ126-NF4]
MEGGTMFGSGKRSRWLGSATAALLALPLVVVPPAAGATPPTTTPALFTQVTLVTGDVVSYSPNAVQISKPRPGVRYDSYRGPDGWHVLPSDAAKAVINGQVDKALFNVTYLVDNGYADAKRTSLPVIVDYDGKAAARSADRVAATDALPASKATRALPSIDAVALDVDKATAAQLWQAVVVAPSTQQRGQGTQRLLLDRRYSVDLAESVAQIKAPAAWAAGFDGTGVRVGVLDTGVDATHPDLVGKIAESASFVGSEPDAIDRHGHGTHVASTIAGSGAAAGGVEKGAAPGTQLVVGKVLSGSGVGYESEIIAGMEWAAGRSKIVSMSLGGPAPSGADPMSDAVTNLTASTGALFVIAAGNSGPAVGTIGSPGTSPSALTVGAVDKQEQVASFSSRGPVADGSVKPEIVAPGVSIVAARAVGTTMGAPVNDKYTAASGTSMATPHVAGAAAVLAQRHPDWTANRLKAALIASTKDLGRPVNDQGAGQVDVKAAIDETVTATPATVGFGVLEPGAGAQTAMLTYRNDGTADVTLNLTTRLTDPTGKAAPDGTLGLGTRSVTVKAGSQAEVPVQLTPGKAGRGSFQGLVTAVSADGSVKVHTPVGFSNGEVTNTVNFTVLGFDGKPLLRDAILWILPVDRKGADLQSYIIHGGGTLRLPTGRYYIALNFYTDEGPGLLETNAMVVKPDVLIDGASHQVLDLGTTRPVTVKTDEPGMESAVIGVANRTTADGAFWSFHHTAGVWDNNLYINPVPTVTAGKFDFQYTTTVTRSQLDVTVNGVAVHPDYLAAYGGGHDWIAPKKLKMFEGRRQLGIVYVGGGTAEEFAAAGDVRGKLVLVQANDMLTGAGIEAARRTAAAGAAGLLLFDKVWATRRSSGDSNELIPVGYLTHPEGVALVAALKNGKGNADVLGNPISPYAYHLAYVERGQVPANLTYTVRTGDLARVDSTYHATTEGMYATSFQRGGVPELMLVEPLMVPSKRAEYYGPITDRTAWTRFTSTDVAGQWEIMSARSAELRRGSRQSDDWYTTPMRYGQGEFFNMPTLPAPYLASRMGDSVYVFPLLQDGNNHVTAMIPNTAVLKTGLSRDGKPVTGIGGAPVTRFDVPADSGRYRLDLGYAPGGDYKVDTAWEFTSAPAAGTAAKGFACWDDIGEVPADKPCQALPTISVDYDLNLSATNTATAPGLGLIKFRPHHVGDIRTKVTSAKLSVSYDGGKSWLRGTQAPVGDGWQLGLVPHLRPGGTVSLRVEAMDKAGNKVTQTITNAYRLAK